MKKIIVIFVGLAISEMGFATDNTLTRFNFVNLSVDSPQVRIWIPYAGKLSNVCGIKIKAGYMTKFTQNIIEALQINGGAFVSADDALAQKVLLTGHEPQGFGAFVNVESRSGKNLNEVFKAIVDGATVPPSGDSLLVVAEGVPCGV